jgi:hypothetical protein
MQAKYAQNRPHNNSYCQGRLRLRWQIFFLSLIICLVSEPTHYVHGIPKGSLQEATPSEIELGTTYHTNITKTFYPPEDFQAYDFPNDGGGQIGLTWKAAPYDHLGAYYAIYLAEEQTGPYFLLDRIPGNTHYKKDLPWPWWTWESSKEYHFYQVKSGKNTTLINGRPYIFKVIATWDDQKAESPLRVAIPRANYFNWNKLNNFSLMIFFTVIILFSINQAKKNPHIFLRRISGLDAVEEAIGRATEMGKAILFLTGSDDMSSISTIAATTILGEVAKRTAVYETELKVPHRDPVVMAVCQEIVKEAYLEAGRPDAYKEDSNFFITTDQFSYTAAVDGIMLRERPAANFYMGFYYAESLLLAETGASTGAIQIAGTDADHQLPFFITACDYTLIGEELYAASAYLSRDPILIGTLRGQDLGKAFFLVILILGTLLATLGQILKTDIFHYLLQLFMDF